MNDTFICGIPDDKTIIVEQTMQKRKTRKSKRIMPDGLNALQQWLWQRDLSNGHLQMLTSSNLDGLIEIDRLNMIVANLSLATDNEKRTIRNVTGVHI